jgi:hypothetical protein
MLGGCGSMIRTTARLVGTKRLFGEKIARASIGSRSASATYPAIATASALAFKAT